MLITDQHTSLFRSSDPPHSPTDRLASWWCTLFRSFSSVSLVASRFVLERPIGPVGLVARSQAGPRVRPTSRPYDPMHREEIVPFALFRSFSLLRLNVISTDTLPLFALLRLDRLLPTTAIPANNNATPTVSLALPTGNRPSVICTNTFYQFERVSRVLRCRSCHSSNQKIDAGLRG